VKNQRLLLEVAAQVREGCPDLRVLVAGAGPLEAALRPEAERLGLGDTIAWLGRVPYPDMPAFYRRGSIYIQTSRHESQGVAVLEALASGLPVLGTPVGLLPSVAALPASSDPARLAEQSLALLSDSVALMEQSRRAAMLLVSEYTLEATTARFVGLYRHVIASYHA
jgi:glycosyltransferase involved in cell wall biosynthesis